MKELPFTSICSEKVWERIPFYSKWQFLGWFVDRNGFCTGIDAKCEELWWTNNGTWNNEQKIFEYLRKRDPFDVNTVLFNLNTGDEATESVNVNKAHEIGEDHPIIDFPGVTESVLPELEKDTQYVIDCESLLHRIHWQIG